MTATEDILAAIEKNKGSLQDIELMINSLNDVRASAHFTYLLVQGRTDPVPGAAFREHARFTYTALESLSKQAIGSEALLNELQASELPKLQGPSPLSIKSKQEEAIEGEQAAKMIPESPFGEETTLESLKRREYLNPVEMHSPCTGCHKHLLFDSQQFKHLPPTLYTYDKPKPAPFHTQCVA
ncbi:hypothetical protein BGZ72_001702 [Mortierella alpina]|nr:hypothetical protein BGZ72_001702 [Mortierella alpina]